jgi:hypothetical protein
LFIFILFSFFLHLSHTGKSNPKFSGEGWSESDNPSPLQRLFGLYFILMAEKAKK